MSSKGLIVVCAGNLAGMSVCPSNCRSCFYGGEIAITWKHEGQEYIQYFPNKHTVREEVEAARQAGKVDARILAFQAWLNANYQDWEKVKVLEPEPSFEAAEISYKGVK